MSYKLSPSKAHRFLNCTKSLEYDLPFIETPATIRGTNLHMLAERRLKNLDTTEIETEQKFNSYENWLIDMYISKVWEEYHRINASRIIIEQKETLEIYGNAINFIMDVLLLAHDTASIIDLKTGNGDVEADDNEQLFFYAYDVFARYEHIEKVRANIFQKGKLKAIVVTRSEIFDFFIEKAKKFQQIAEDKLEYAPSEKACKFCAYKDKCIARAEWIIGGKK